MNTLKLSPVHPKKPKIVALPMRHLGYYNFPYMYVCKDQHGWYCTMSLFSAMSFYSEPSHFNGARTHNLSKEIAMRLAVSNILRIGKGN